MFIMLIYFFIIMTIFECKYCKKSFSKRNNMYRHIKNSCKVAQDVKQNNISIESAIKKIEFEKDKQEVNICHKCNKKFSCYSSLHRHKKSYCKVIRREEAEKQKVYDELVLEMRNLRKELNEFSDIKDRVDKLEKENNKLKKENKYVNNGIIHYGKGDINMMDITVNIVPFGKEDLSKISKNDLLKVFRCGFNSALKLTETTHFNPKYPEYHNVYISSMKNKYAMTYNGTDWSLVMKDELINDMYDKKRDYIAENIDEFINSLTSSQISALHRWLDVDDEHKYIQKIKNDMKLLLYNKRKMALEPKPIIKISDSNNMDITKLKNTKKHNIKKTSKHGYKKRFP